MGPSSHKKWEPFFARLDLSGVLECEASERGVKVVQLEFAVVAADARDNVRGNGAQRAPGPDKQLFTQYRDWADFSGENTGGPNWQEARFTP